MFFKILKTEAPGNWKRCLKSCYEFPTIRQNWGTVLMSNKRKTHFMGRESFSGSGILRFYNSHFYS